MKILTLVLLAFILGLVSLLIYWAFVGNYPHVYPYLLLILIVSIVSYFVIIQKRHRNNYLKVVRDIDALRRMIIHQLRADKLDWNVYCESISIMLYLIRENITDCMCKPTRDRDE